MLLSMIIIFIAAVCITGLLGLGMQLIWSGLCGKAIDRHPLCGKCNFDLVGHTSRPNRCPECGSIIARAGGIQIGHRKQQVSKIVHGSILVVINLNIVVFCWLTAEQPASANSVAMIPTARTVPISLTVSSISITPLEVKTASDTILLIADPTATFALNVDSTISNGLTLPGDQNSFANSITLDQLLFSDEKAKLLGLPAQPASGVISALFHKGMIGKQYKPKDHGTVKTVRNKRFKAILKVSNLIIPRQLDTNRIIATRTGHVVIAR